MTHYKRIASRTLLLVAGGLCLSSVGCSAKALEARAAFARAVNCEDLRHTATRPAEAPVARRVNFQLAYDSGAGKDPAWVSASGVALNHAYVAGAMGMPEGRGGAAVPITLRFSDKAPCAANTVDVRGGVITGCRIDGCRLEGRFEGRRLTWLTISTPARPGGDPDETTLVQGRCAVAGVAVAAGIDDLWRDDLKDAVRLAPGHSISQGIYAWQLNPSSKVMQCLNAIWTEID